MNRHVFSKLTGFTAFANLIFGFGQVGFKFAEAFGNPSLMLAFVFEPAGIGMMILFLLSDWYGWYHWPPKLAKRLAEELDFAVGPITALANIYSSIGKFGVLFFGSAYFASLLFGMPGEYLVKASVFTYTVIWGIINNTPGAILFAFLAVGLWLDGQRGASIFSGLTSAFMGLTAFGYAITKLNVSDWYTVTSQVFSLVYLVTFCFVWLTVRLKKEE